MGLFGDVGNAISHVVGGGAAIATGGLYNPRNGSIGLGNATSGGVLTNGLGYQAEGLGIDPITGKPKQPAAPGGTPMDAALMSQLQAELGIANINANAMQNVANTQADAQRQMAQAGVQQSRQSAIGMIIGAAMGAHQTSEQIKQWLPHESGAAAIKSYELAQKWNTTISMKQQGYQDVAINYALNNKDGRALWRDPQWNAMKMAEDLKKDTLTNLQMFGVKSDKNPNGVAISPEDYIELMSFKPADSILKIDPAVAQQRNKAFEDWEAKMRKDGLGMIVDMYKNPQLSGTSILSMKGPEPIIDPQLAPLLNAMSGGDPKMDSLIKAGTNPQQQEESMFDQYRSDPKLNPISAASYKPTGEKPGVDVASLTNSNNFNAELKKLNAQYAGRQNTPEYQAAYQQLVSRKSNTDLQNNQAAQDAANMNSAWSQVMNGGQGNPKTEEIKRLQEMGVIDKYGMVNGGVLMSFIPPELTAAPEFSTNRQIGDKEKAMLMDEYNKFANTPVDPKNIKTEALGQGVTRKTLLNADGTIAGSMMEGYMQNAMGESVFVSMSGTRLQNWYDKMTQINGLGPLFPGIMAPVTDSELNGTFEPGFWNQQPGAPTYKPMSANGQNSKPQGDSRMQQEQELPTAPKPLKQTTKVSSSKVPAGYAGAPLAAGG